jgi:hypothetical protein
VEFPSALKREILRVMEEAKERNSKSLRVMEKAENT